MDKVTKVFYDPLMREKGQIETLLLTLPIGSAHPFRGQLLVRSTRHGITSLDISMHPDGYFTNAVCLDELGEQVLDRMKLFPQEIGMFNEGYSIQQAPSSSFEVPIVDELVHIFAVSVREPSYYDLCVGDSDYNTCCYSTRHTFKGITHSGDCNASNVLLQHIKLTPAMDETPRAVFVSGYSNHALHTYKKRNPLVLVANHSTKTLYIVPVPLDTATIGQEATICCPLVIKKNARSNTLQCSILPTPTIDKDLYCVGRILRTAAFAQAVSRADVMVELQQPQEIGQVFPSAAHASTPEASISVTREWAGDAQHVIIATHFSTIDAESPAQGSTLPTVTPQIIRFGKGIDWMPENGDSRAGEHGSTSVLPCIFGSMMQGPMLLAIGETPTGVPFSSMTELHEYYRNSKSIFVLVDENMTDNARNVATTWRLNGLFILQTNKAVTPDDGADVIPILDKLNVNAITALAGPQSLIIVQLGTKYFFYRGIANPQLLDVSTFQFGQEVTELVLANGLTKMAEKAQHPSWPRLVDLAQDNTIYSPWANRMFGLEEIKSTFKEASVADILTFKDDIAAIVPQLQALLPQEKLHDICQTLIQVISANVNDDIEPLRREYAKFVVQEFDPTDAESVKKKNMLLSNLRKKSKEALANVKWLTASLGNVVSTQTSSSRTHDLKRLARQTAIQGNVAIAKAMTFEKVAAVLEEHASQMGVLLANVSTAPYKRYISESLYLAENPASTTVEPCFLDQRVLYLEGLDAGIVLEASQAEHSGPLVNRQGQDHPILALPYLSKTLGRHGSMLAWVCWDEFVQLRNPYKVRWMEKCNDPNIAALRIVMRSTLSDAVSSRDVTNLEPSSKATGQLMGALLMTAMRKLAETRSTIPEVVTDLILLEGSSSENTHLVTVEDTADTSTLLMRGMFGNLLTIAGSGTQPMSYVWQLFGKVPTFEIPTSNVAWSWYEHTTRLLPYAAWPLEQYKVNVVGLLDKLIFRMMTKSEQPEKAASGSVKRIKSLQQYCKARNIQLLHSRTIITTLEKMLTEQGEADCQASAYRLLRVIPEHVENETGSYTRLFHYIQHLAEGGKQRSHDSIIAANVFTKRSAVFGEAKRALAEALAGKELDRPRIVEACRHLLAMKAAIEKNWGLEEGTAKIQNSKPIYEVIDASLSEGEPLKISKEAIEKIRSDAEMLRKPWQIGDKGEFGDIEKLDKKLVSQVLGRDLNISEMNQHVQASRSEHDKSEDDRVLAVRVEQDELARFKGTHKAEFLDDVKTTTSVEDVCRLLGLTLGALRAFVGLLVPDHQMKVETHLALSFKKVVLMLLRDRCRDPEKMKPTKMLLGIE